MNLFMQGDFVVAEGAKLTWKIECDALTSDDWATLAVMTVERMSTPFARVLGVPQGGLAYAEALSVYADPEATDRVLVADDVWMTGGSMDRFITAKGLDRNHLMRVVAFARSPTPEDVVALFQMLS